MKTVYTFCTFSLVVLLMIGCAKEEQQQPSTTGTTYTSGNNQNNNSGNNNNSSGKPINNNSTLPVNHPVGSAAACGGCHKGFLKVPDWVKDGIAKEEADMLKLETNSLQEQKPE